MAQNVKIEVASHRGTGMPEAMSGNAANGAMNRPVESGASVADADRLAAVLAENERRNEALRKESEAYDPVKGVGSYGERRERSVRGERYRVPVAMIESEPRRVFDSKGAFARARMRYDFEYWCARCVKIRDKVSGKEIPLILNRAQRRLLSVLERQRTAGAPVRVILLKARQWGGSTLVQMYMAWIQIMLHKNWNSLICGHLRDTASAIKGIYSRLLSNYPTEFLPEGTAMRFSSFEGSKNASVISGRGCVVMMGSAQSQESVRGYDLSMAHLTEVGFWPETDRHNPEDVVRSVSGTVEMKPDTVIVYESTANGMGNFFHTEWLRARAGESDKEAVFVPWYEIELYRRPVANAAQLWGDMDEYERDLWEKDGCTLEMINWYHHKRREYQSHAQMKAEFPSNDIEAFSNTGRNVFDMNQLVRFGRSCREPIARGEVSGDYKTLKNIRWAESETGKMAVWQWPKASVVKSRWVVTVDVGGRSDKADYSVISVIDRGESYDSKPEVVAQWRGHIDHDLLAWKSAQVARFYNNALLVVESNTLESEYTEGDSSEFVLDVISRHYGNVYRRPKTNRAGFQTNRETKQGAVSGLIECVRDGLYVERDMEAVNEMSWYEVKQNGGYGAKRGRHDDILMTRAIGMAVVRELNEQRLRRHLHPLRVEDFI